MNPFEEPPAILWTGILRNETLLVQTRAEGPEAVETARNLLNKSPSTGWDSFHSHPLRGIKLHLYEDDYEGKLLLWVFACVYDSSRITRTLAQAFVEQKMVHVTENFRETNQSWRFGDHLACQDCFGSVLRQRADEMSYHSETALADDSDDQGYSNQIIANNNALLQRRIEKRHAHGIHEQTGIFRYWREPDSQGKTLLRGWEHTTKEESPSLTKSHGSQSWDTPRAGRSEDDEDVVSVTGYLVGLEPDEPGVPISPMSSPIVDKKPRKNVATVPVNISVDLPIVPSSKFGGIGSGGISKPSPPTKTQSIPRTAAPATSEEPFRFAYDIRTEAKLSCDSTFEPPFDISIYSENFYANLTEALSLIGGGFQEVRLEF